MARFRKKPVLIEAEQFLPPDSIPAGVLREKKVTHERRYYVVTIHGQAAFVESGDWIIVEPDGLHHYPCKPYIFAAAYEPA